MGRKFSQIGVMPNLVVFFIGREVSISDYAKRLKPSVLTTDLLTRLAQKRWEWMLLERHDVWVWILRYLQKPG